VKGGVSRGKGGNKKAGSRDGAGGRKKLRGGGRSRTVGFVDGTKKGKTKKRVDPPQRYRENGSIMLGQRRPAEIVFNGKKVPE